MTLRFRNLSIIILRSNNEMSIIEIFYDVCEETVLGGARYSETATASSLHEFVQVSSLF